MEQPLPKRQEVKQVRTIDEMEFVNQDLQEKYAALLASSSMLEAEKEKWKAAFEAFESNYNNAVLGYHTLDENGLIIKMNQTELDWLGLTREEVIGKMTEPDLLAPDSRKMYFQIMSIVKEEGEVSQLEVDYKAKDGTIYTRQLSARAVTDAEGNFKGVRISLSDISELKNTQDELIEATRNFRRMKDKYAESIMIINELTDQLSSFRNRKQGAAQYVFADLLQPVNDLKQLCDNLLREEKSQDTSRLQRLQKLFDQVNLISNIVQANKPDASSIPEVSLSRINVSELLNTLANKYGRIEKNIKDEVWLETDQQYLSEILNQMLGNAVVLASDDKEIHLKLKSDKRRNVIDLEVREPEAHVGVIEEHKYMQNIFSTEHKDLHKSFRWNLESIQPMVEKIGGRLIKCEHRDKGKLMVRLVLPHS